MTNTLQIGRKANWHELQWCKQHHAAAVWSNQRLRSYFRAPVQKKYCILVLHLQLSLEDGTAWAVEHLVFFHDRERIVVVTLTVERSTWAIIITWNLTFFFSGRIAFDMFALARAIFSFYVFIYFNSCFCKRGKKGKISYYEHLFHSPNKEMLRRWFLQMQVWTPGTIFSISATGV